MPRSEIPDSGHGSTLTVLSGLIRMVRFLLSVRTTWTHGTMNADDYYREQIAVCRISTHAKGVNGLRRNSAALFTLYLRLPGRKARIWSAPPNRRSMVALSWRTSVSQQPQMKTQTPESDRPASCDGQIVVAKITVIVIGPAVFYAPRIVSFHGRCLLPAWFSHQTIFWKTYIQAFAVRP